VSILRFEIRHRDGRKEIANVEGERVLIGNGAHCDIRLPLDQAAIEHVAVEVIGGTVRIETKAFDPPATVNGMPFTNVPLPPDVPLKIGSTWIYIALGEVGVDPMGPVLQQKKGSEPTSPFMKVVGLLVLGAGAYMMMSGDDEAIPEAPAQVPELFTTTSPTCPQSAADQALSIAADKYDQAEGKRERSPFAPKEGVEAEQSYEMAAACYRQGGDIPHSVEAADAAKQLRDAITLDFRARRVRLEHLMTVGDYQLARNDVTVLSSLTEGKEGSWVSWLNEANRTIKQRTAKR
jgi:hypothetical protein